MHTDAVEPKAGESKLGSYDLYIPSGQDNRVEIAVQGALREAIIGARMGARGLDRDAVSGLVTVARVRSVSVSAEGERGTVGGFNFVVPVAFMFLLFMGVMGAGQGMLTTTIEEKSSRVIEVLLSAVSPMQLMGGKLIGHMGISLIAMSLYIALGLVDARVVLAVRPARPVAAALFVHLLLDRVLHDRLADDGGRCRGQRHARGAAVHDAAVDLLDAAVDPVDADLARIRIRCLR